jgi:hypothetical protein
MHPLEIYLAVDRRADTSSSWWMSMDQETFCLGNRKKVRRVVKSTLAAETLALLDAAEAGVYFANFITELLNLPGAELVKCFVDNKSLVDSLHSTKSVDDKHLRINLALLSDMLERGDLSSVTWVQSARQLANVLTKRGASAHQLLSAVGGVMPAEQ